MNRSHLCITLPVYEALNCGAIQTEFDVAGTRTALRVERFMYNALYTVLALNVSVFTERYGWNSETRQGALALIGLDWEYKNFIYENNFNKYSK